MKHLNIYESFEYSKELKYKINHFGWNESKVRYIIAPPRSKNPESGEYVGSDFLLAVEELKRMNLDYGVDTFCLFESKIRVLSEEEIDFQLTTKKYNI